MLAGVILFNHNDFGTLHFIFAIAFFAGSSVAIVLFSSRKERWFKWLMVVVIAVVMMGSFLFDWISLFLAEWISLGIIALHYILESMGVID
jgi:hypothetical protein